MARQTAAQKKALATAAQKKALATPAITYDDDEANGGFEEADSSSFAIPFLNILQSGSPQCKKSDGAYIEGAGEGALFDTVSGEIYDGDEGKIVVPCHFKRSFIEWGQRDNGGGFVAEHSAEDGLVLRGTCTKNEKNQDVLPNGNILQDTRVHFVLIGDTDMEPGTALSPAVISMASTQIKKSRKWMTMMQQLKMHRANGEPFTPPMYSHIYHVTTIPESNDQGSWFGWKIINNGPVTDPGIHHQAKEFRAAILSGEAKVQPPVDENPSAEEF